MPLEFAAWCKYIPRADPELDPTSIRASRELYFSARTTSPLRQIEYGKACTQGLIPIVISKVRKVLLFSLKVLIVHCKVLKMSQALNVLAVFPH